MISKDRLYNSLQAINKKMVKNRHLRKLNKAKRLSQMVKTKLSLEALKIKKPNQNLI
jgi:hypothetical protein